MSNLSRRLLVTGAVALPALALPAIPTASCDVLEPDPIFAALDRFNKAVAAENACYDVRSDAQDAFLSKYGTLRPDALPKEVRQELQAKIDRRFVSVRLGDHHAISELKTIEWISPEVRAGFHRELNRQQAAYDATVQPAEDAADAALEKRWNAQQAVLATVPTTLAGFQAKIDFALSADFVTDTLTNSETDDTLGNFLNTLRESARLLAVQS